MGQNLNRVERKLERNGKCKDTINTVTAGVVEKHTGATYYSHLTNPVAWCLIADRMFRLVVDWFSSSDTAY